MVWRALENFFGPMLSMWLAFHLFSVFVSKRRLPISIPADASYWGQPIVFWLLIVLQFPLLAAIAPSTQLIDATGHVWSSSDLFQSMALVSLFTMIFTACLAWLILARQRELIKHR